MMFTKTIEVDFSNSKHTDDVLALLSVYACDIMGGGKDLSVEVKKNLIPALAKRNDVLAVLVYERETAIGLAVCFEGFSTFYAKPLLNIHDFVVKKSHRGQGVAKILLEKIEAISKERGYCKLTLEVLEGNSRAQKVYKDFGFSGYELDPVMGKAIFLDKKLAIEEENKGIFKRNKPIFAPNL